MPGHKTKLATNKVAKEDKTVAWAPHVVIVAALGFASNLKNFVPYLDLGVPVEKIVTPFFFLACFVLFVRVAWRMHARKDRGKFGWRLAVIAVLAFASVAMTAYHGYRLYRLLFLNESAARAELCESLTALENARIDEAKRHLLEGKTFIADSRWKEGNAHATLVELEIARRMQRLDVNSPLLDSAETAVLSSRVAPLITWFRLLRAETQGRAGLGQRVLETLDEISATDALPGQKSWIALEHARTYRRLGQSREAIAEYEAALATATAESDTWRSAVVAGARIPTRSLISIVTSRNSLTRSANSLRSGGTESRLHTGT